MKKLFIIKILVKLSPLFILLSLSGCSAKSGVVLQRQDIDATGKIAIASVTMPRIADLSRESNRAVLRASLDLAREQATENLQSFRTWNILDLSGAKLMKIVRSFGAVSDDEVRAKFLVKETAARAGKEIEEARSSWKDQYLSAEGLPIVPRSALVPAPGSSQSEPLVQSVMLDQAGKLCAALGVDAVVFVHVHAAITHPREKTFIVRDNRTDGALRMAQSLVMVDRSGRIIADLGPPELEKRTRTRDLLPVYLGAGKDAIRRENIDLGDSRKKVAQAIRSLIEETSADMDALFRKEAEN
jgi:hypothetical protein